MATSTGPWEKFKTPPDILTVESKLKTLKLTSEQINEMYMNVIDNNILNSTDSKEKKAWADIKVKRKAKTMMKRLEEAFIEDFNLWLHGKSPYNVVSKQTTQYLGNNIVGVVARQNEVEFTPWGNKPLTFIPEVRQYLEGPILNRDHVIKVLSKLKLTGPRNIEEAWVYYKYIVRKVGIDGDVINEQNMFSDFDYLTRNIYKKEDPGNPFNHLLEVDNRYKKGSANNPAPPQFDQRNYEIAKTEVLQMALNGNAGISQSDYFKMLGPEDRVFMLSFWRPRFKAPVLGPLGEIVLEAADRDIPAELYAGGDTKSDKLKKDTLTEIRDLLAATRRTNQQVELLRTNTSVRLQELRNKINEGSMNMLRINQSIAEFSERFDFVGGDASVSIRNIPDALWRAGGVDPPPHPPPPQPPRRAPGQPPPGEGQPSSGGSPPPPGEGQPSSGETPPSGGMLKRSLTKLRSFLPGFGTKNIPIPPSPIVVPNPLAEAPQELSLIHI
jgi:hypothetical protein